MKKKYLIGLLFCIIIIVGIILTATIGLNLNLMYSNHKSIDIYLEKEFDNNDIYKIAKEVFGNEEVKVQKVELYEDIASIIVKDATDEQLEQLSSKINEKYELEKTTEDMVITEVPEIKTEDLIKPYIAPTIISFVIVVIYLVIYIVINSKERKDVNIFKEILKAIITIIGIELLYLSVLAITRIEVGYWTLPIGVIIYVFTTILMLLKLEKRFKKQEKKK